MTTTAVATAAGRTRQAVRLAAAAGKLGAQLVDTPRGLVWVLPDTAPDGRPWCPESYAAASGVPGRPRKTHGKARNA